MGLIKALAGATGGTLADQWKEYFYCEAMDSDVREKKGLPAGAVTKRAVTISLQAVLLLR